ncbi:MAG: hypothetical protein WBJ54_02860, partial [Syntrophorhabdus sp.]
MLRLVYHFWRFNTRSELANSLTFLKLLSAHHSAHFIAGSPFVEMLYSDEIPTLIHRPLLVFVELWYR